MAFFDAVDAQSVDIVVAKHVAFLGRKRLCGLGEGPAKSPGVAFSQVLELRIGGGADKHRSLFVAERALALKVAKNGQPLPRCDDAKPPPKVSPPGVLGDARGSARCGDEELDEEPLLDLQDEVGLIGPPAKDASHVFEEGGGEPLDGRSIPRAASAGEIDEATRGLRAHDARVTVTALHPPWRFPHTVRTRPTQGGRPLPTGRAQVNRLDFRADPAGAA